MSPQSSETRIPVTWARLSQPHGGCINPILIKRPPTSTDSRMVLFKSTVLVCSRSNISNVSVVIPIIHIHRFHVHHFWRKTVQNWLHFQDINLDTRAKRHGRRLSATRTRLSRLGFSRLQLLSPSTMSTVNLTVTDQSPAFLYSPDREGVSVSSWQSIWTGSADSSYDITHTQNNIAQGINFAVSQLFFSYGHTRDLVPCYLSCWRVCSNRLCR